jgi:hypothetical protein
MGIGEIRGLSRRFLHILDRNEDTRSGVLKKHERGKERRRHRVRGQEEGREGVAEMSTPAQNEEGTEKTRSRKGRSTTGGKRQEQNTHKLDNDCRHERLPTEVASWR